VLIASLEHARENKLVLQTFGHAPKLDFAEYVSDFDWAANNGVQMVTFKDLANGFKGAGCAFTVDDSDVDIWWSWRERLRQHHVKATFFVTGYDKLTDAQKQELRELAKDGHDIEAHGKAHENALDYIKAHDLDTYMRDEVLPSKTALVTDGFSPIAFAYPYGAHNTTIDTALLAQFQLLRTTGGDNCLK
jgi:peptidoglycan/xylan/chitin deacetylase (PgdA/CDA1 family)